MAGEDDHDVTVLKVVRALSPDGVNPDSIMLETPLAGSQSPFDSIRLLEVLLAIEKAFGVRLGEQDVTPDTFKSVSQLAAALRAVAAR